LGHDFLRHIERTRLLIHLLDGTGEDPLEAFETINAELTGFDERLGAKPQIVAFNKMDMPDAQALWPLVYDELSGRGYEVVAISGIARQGTRELLYKAAQRLAEIPQIEAAPIAEIPVLRPDLEDDVFTVTREGAAWHITGERIERLARRTRWDLYEAVNRFQKTLEREGITQALEQAGVRSGDTVFIGEIELEWGEDADEDADETD
jgi:GTP-binding protein